LLLLGPCALLVLDEVQVPAGVVAEGSVPLGWKLRDERPAVRASDCDLLVSLGQRLVVVRRADAVRYLPVGAAFGRARWPVGVLAPSLVRLAVPALAFIAVTLELAVSLACPMGDSIRHVDSQSVGHDPGRWQASRGHLLEGSATAHDGRIVLVGAGSVATHVSWLEVAQRVAAALGDRDDVIRSRRHRVDGSPAIRANNPVRKAGVYRLAADVTGR